MVCQLQNLHSAPCKGALQKLVGRMTQAHDRLLIIDFGSQVTQLIARRLRELNVYCEIHPFNKIDGAFLAAFAPKAVILSGGPASVYNEGAPMPPAGLFDLGVPILGICYGQQVMMHVLGGHVEVLVDSMKVALVEVEMLEEPEKVLTTWALRTSLAAAVAAMVL